MQLTYYLDKQDLVDVLARIFRVEPEDVHVGVKEQWVGYGPNDGTIRVPFAQIECEMSIRKEDNK